MWRLPRTVQFVSAILMLATLACGTAIRRDSSTPQLPPVSIADYEIYSDILWNRFYSDSKLHDRISVNTHTLKQPPFDSLQPVRWGRFFDERTVSRFVRESGLYFDSLVIRRFVAMADTAFKLDTLFTDSVGVQVRTDSRRELIHVELSRVGFSRDSSHALLYVGYVRGTDEVYGYGYLLIVGRDSNHWGVIAEKHLWSI